MINLNNVLYELVSKIKLAITEIKELDTMLTEISKRSDMTAPQKKQFAADAYDTARYSSSVMSTH